MLSNFVNYFFTTVGVLICSQETKESFSIGLVFDLIFSNAGFMIVVFISFGVFLTIILQLFLQEKYELLFSCYEKN